MTIVYYSTIIFPRYMVLAGCFVSTVVPVRGIIDGNPKPETLDPNVARALRMLKPCMPSSPLFWLELRNSGKIAFVCPELSFFKGQAQGIKWVKIWIWDFGLGTSAFGLGCWFQAWDFRS